MNSLTTLTIYFLFSWLIALAFYTRKNITSATTDIRPYALYYLPTFIVGIYFIALKPFSAGGDTTRYLISYSMLGNPFTATEDAGYGSEILFWPIQAFIHMWADPREWLVTHFIIVTALNYYAYKKITENTNLNPALALILFITYYVVYDALAMRQAYAVPISAIAFCYALEKKNAKFLFYTILASSFHWSALVFILSPLLLYIPNRRIFLYGIPASALLIGSIIPTIADIAVSLTGAEWLADKTSAYIKGNYQSHLTTIWESMNFWLNITLYVLLIETNTFKKEEFKACSKFMLFIVTLMLTFSEYVDVSDRLMVNAMFMTPLVLALITNSLKIKNLYKNFIYSSILIAMAALVYTRPTLIEALGI